MEFFQGTMMNAVDLERVKVTLESKRKNQLGGTFLDEYACSKAIPQNFMLVFHTFFMCCFCIFIFIFFVKRHSYWLLWFTPHSVEAMGIEDSVGIGSLFPHGFWRLLFLFRLCYCSCYCILFDISSGFFSLRLTRIGNHPIWSSRAFSRDISPLWSSSKAL